MGRSYFSRMGLDRNFFYSAMELGLDKLYFCESGVRQEQRFLFFFHNKEPVKVQIKHAVNWITLNYVVVMCRHTKCWIRYIIHNYSLYLVIVKNMCNIFRYRMISNQCKIVIQTIEEMRSSHIYS